MPFGVRFEANYRSVASAFSYKWYQGDALWCSLRS
jgi:hypothetical protein